MQSGSFVQKLGKIRGEGREERREGGKFASWVDLAQESKQKSATSIIEGELKPSQDDGTTI